MNTLPNPWMALPAKPPYVLDVDRPFVDAWNKTYDDRHAEIRLRTEVLPSPFVGPRDASVVILGRNPGWSPSESLEWRTLPRMRAAMLANLDDDPKGHSHWGLLGGFADTAGGRWSRKLLRAVHDAGFGYEELAQKVLVIEFHGYHSEKWALLPVTLPSQWYGFDLVASAIRRRAVIILTRGVRDWEVAVPALRGYRLAFRTNTARSAAISPGNLPKHAFGKLIRALSAPPRSDW